MIAAWEIGDYVAVYAAGLSTALAIVGGIAWWRRRKIKIGFSHRWEETADKPATLRIYLHNDSPLATLHLLQIGWRTENGMGDYWDAPGSSIVIEPGATYSHDFKITSPLESRVMATARLGDRTEHRSKPFEIRHLGVSRLDGDELTLLTDS